jgi:hypothetical protein
MRCFVLGVVCSFAFAAQSASQQLHVVAVPDRLDARVSDAAPMALVAVVLGLEATTTPLPGGGSLGLLPIAVAALAIADAAGVATATLGFPVGHAAGLELLAQAVAFDVSLTIGVPGALVATPLRTVRVPTVSDPVDLVVLFGQSNAEGAASLTELQTSLHGPHPHLRVWNDAVAAWQPLQAGANTMLILGTPAVGPELGIVDLLRPKSQAVWLVKCAVWQSSLGPTPGPFNEWGAQAGELYPEMLRRIDNAAAGVIALGLTPRVRLVCMMQGESDALDPGLAAAYAANLQDLILQLRHDLASRGLSGVDQPFFRIGQISPALANVGFLATGVVRAAQAAVTAGLPGCDLIDTATMEQMPDHVHFSLTGLRALGRAFGRGFVTR